MEKIYRREQKLMKYEWRKREKNLYIPKQEPELISIPEQKFFLIKGKGNPNEHEFAEKIGFFIHWLMRSG